MPPKRKARKSGGKSKTKAAKKEDTKEAKKESKKETKETKEEKTRLSTEPRLKDKVCLISGASRGFGQGIAVRFVEEGAKVVLLSRSPCTETVDLISKIEGLKDVDSVSLWAKCDIDNEKEIEAAVAATVKKFGKEIHVLVNNAARFIFKNVETATAKDWDETAATNIKGHALLTKAVIPYMKKKGGSIVFQGSISSFAAQPNCVTYSATKAAICLMARNCAYDLAKYNIRCNTICAGTIETPISVEERAAHGWTYEHWEGLKTKDVILRRVGTVREVANATLFFASDESSYCTGADLMVDGGQRACTIMVDED